MFKHSLNFLGAIVTMSLLTCCGGGDMSTSPTDKAHEHGQEQKTVAPATTAAAYEGTVQTLYVAYFGRPADPLGLVNFENALLAAGAPVDIGELNSSYASNTSIRALIDSFGTSSESQTLYGGGTTDDFVTAVYQNLLNRQPEQSGLTFWSDAIANASLSQGNAALAIAAGAYANQSSQGVLDAQLIGNRVGAATYFTQQLVMQNATSAYAGQAAAWNARTMLTQVTASTETAIAQSNAANEITLLVEENAAYNAVNSFRESVGLSNVPQNLSLYMAAAEHANYEHVNGTDAHTETPGTPGYLAVDPGTRAEAFGYPNIFVTEELGYSSTTNANLAGQGVATTKSLIDTVYHRVGLLYQYLTSIGVALNTGGGGAYSINDLEFGFDIPTSVSGNFLGIYPLDGQIGVALSMQPEYPNPFPNLTNVQFATQTGYPISVNGPTNSGLTIISFTVTQVGQSSPLTTTTFTGADPNFGGNNNLAFIVPNAPLLANTTYSANFVGTSNGVAINRTWSFTTGSGN